MLWEGGGFSHKALGECLTKRDGNSSLVEDKKGNCKGGKRNSLYLAIGGDRYGRFKVITKCER